MVEHSDARADIAPSERIEYLEAALIMIEEVRAHTLRHFHECSYEVQLKDDASPVTKADLDAEQMLRTALSRRFPTHGIIGEEYPTTFASDYYWTIDPIDGTQNFAAGIPTFGTMLSLRYRNRPVVAVIDHPALRVCCYASFGSGTYCNGVPVKITDEPIAALTPELIVNTSTRGMFERSGEGWLLDRFLKLHPTTRMYFDCYAHTLTACGHLAATVEFNVRIWDMSPTELLVQEAGGAFRYVRRQPTVSDHSQGYLSAVFGRPAVVELLEPLFVAEVDDEDDEGLLGRSFAAPV